MLGPGGVGFFFGVLTVQRRADVHLQKC
jgi:hypothetical protein